MIEIGSTIVRKVVKFIPAMMMKVQHVEHTYKLNGVKSIQTKKAQIKKWESTTTSYSSEGL